MKTITTHYIDGAFVESHGHEIMDMIKPTNGQVIARVTLADEDAFDDPLGRRLDVRVRAHDVRGRAAELEGEPLAPQRGGLRDRLADLG